MPEASLAQVDEAGQVSLEIAEPGPGGAAAGGKVAAGASSDEDSSDGEAYDVARFRAELDRMEAEGEDDEAEADVAKWCDALPIQELDSWGPLRSLHVANLHTCNL